MDNPNFCSPERQNNGQTCFTKNELESIAKEYNKKSKQKINTALQMSKIHEELLKKTNCKNDICIAKKYKVNKNKIFLPKQNRLWKDNPNEWLDTFDIEKSLYQYETKYPHFKFFGATPIDICATTALNTKVLGTLCDIEIKKLLDNGKTQLGVVFNTDTHDKPGQHWFASFMDLAKNELYLFDSNGIGNTFKKGIKELKNQKIDRVYNPIVKVLKKIKKQGNELFQQYKYPDIIKKPFKIFYNTTVHQQDSQSECGMYSIYIIIQLLNGKTFQELNKQRIPDKYVFKLRNIYYRPNLNSESHFSTIFNNLLDIFKKSGGSKDDEYEYIVDPKSLKQKKKTYYKITSKKGLTILRNYIIQYLKS